MKKIVLGFHERDFKFFSIPHEISRKFYGVIGEVVPTVVKSGQKVPQCCRTAPDETVPLIPNMCGCRGFPPELTLV